MCMKRGTALRQIVPLQKENMANSQHQALLEPSSANIDQVSFLCFLFLPGMLIQDVGEKFISPFWWFGKTAFRSGYLPRTECILSSPPYNYSQVRGDHFVGLFEKRSRDRPLLYPKLSCWSLLISFRGVLITRPRHP
jgi:hypothetical protein